MIVIVPRIGTGTFDDPYRPNMEVVTTVNKSTWKIIEDLGDEYKIETE